MWLYMVMRPYTLSGVAVYGNEAVHSGVAVYGNEAVHSGEAVHG